MTRAKIATSSTLQAMEPGHDNVFRPAHYTQYHGVECKDVSSRMPAAEGQAVQYIWRHDAKGDPVGDLNKGLQWLYMANHSHAANTSDDYDLEVDNRGNEVTYGPTPPWCPEDDETLKRYVMLAVHQMPALTGSAILHIYRQDYQQAIQCVYALLAELDPKNWGFIASSHTVDKAGVKSAPKKRVTKKAKR